jgi:hypothetical protein
MISPHSLLHLSSSLLHLSFVSFAVAAGLIIPGPYVIRVCVGKITNFSNAVGLVFTTPRAPMGCCGSTPYRMDYVRHP